MEKHNYYKIAVFFFSLLAALVLTPLNAIAGFGNPFNKIVFFGDSLTDNGNLFAFDLGYLPKSPPYFEGRFSNGNVWSEYLANHFYDTRFINSSNFAVGGETAILHDPTGGYLPLSLTASKDAYLLRTAFSDRATSLFIIWIGANDYLPGLPAGEDIDGFTSKVVNNIKYNIENLIYHGALNFLILNLPDLAKTPFGIQSKDTETLGAMTLLHNLKIDTAIAEIEAGYRGVNIQLYDANSAFERLIGNLPKEDKTKLHITHTKSACFQGGYTLRQFADRGRLAAEIENQFKAHTLSQPQNNNVQNLSESQFAHFVSASPALSESYRVSKGVEAGGRPCNIPEEYVFWDRVHPTTTVHQLLALRMFEFINDHFQPL